MSGNVIGARQAPRFQERECDLEKTDLWVQHRQMLLQEPPNVLVEPRIERSSTAVELHVLLLPIPILDGGHAFLFLIEGLRGRRVSERSQVAFQKVGLVVIGSLIIFAGVNDSLRIFDRWRARSELDQQAPAERSP